jgi:arylsulfatase A-like enzyme
MNFYGKRHMHQFSSRPNFLFIIVDEERYPPGYESAAVKEWRKKYLVAQELLREHGLEFHRHYAGATACSPSRTTLFTGQYPSLHGVTQTSGLAKEAFDADMFWLDHNSVPTMGNYFQQAGYRTYYKGKWHISEEDILIPGTKNPLPSYNPENGVPDKKIEEIYLQANRLKPFGFSGWIGPEPHGSNPRNSGSSARIGLSGRDIVYAKEAADLIYQLDQEKAARGTVEPWLIVASFVNPHDITLYGSLSERSPYFKFEVDDTVPNIAPPPTIKENLQTKPQCQRSYRRVYPKALQPTPNNNFYRQLYYQLQKNADEQILKVLKAIKRSSFYQDTIIIFTSDHGELLGAHDGLHQKWYCAYEEAIHVPLIIHNPILFPTYQSEAMLTSHLDLLPTMLGIAGADVPSMQTALKKNHTEVHPFVGRNLSSLVLGTGTPERADEPLYFMTDDDPTRGLHQVTFFGRPYKSVVQPNHLETVIASFRTENRNEIWKYSRYFDNPQFWSDPGKKDVVTSPSAAYVRISKNATESTGVTTTKKRPRPEEYELYNLTDDPYETTNLAFPQNQTAQSKKMIIIMAQLLVQQCQQKRLYPLNGEVPGAPSCE